MLESENIYMLLDSNPNNDAVEKVALFESMIKGETFTFFDVEDFELIIEYYLELNFKKKAKKALEIALEQYPIDLALILIKIEFLNSSQKFDESLKALNNLNKFHPNNIDVVLGLGRLYSLMENKPNAIKYLNLAQSLISLDLSLMQVQLLQI